MLAGVEGDPHAASIVTLEAVHAARRAGNTSIASIADQLGIDRSGASRLISTAVDDCLVAKRSSGDDRRRIDVTITDDGERLLAQAHTWQANTFQAMVADWPTADVERFSRYLVRLADQTRNPPEQP